MFNLITFILTYVSYRLSIISSVSGVILFVIYYYNGIYLSKEIDKNKVGYITVFSLILSIFLTFILFSLI